MKPNPTWPAWIFDDSPIDDPFGDGQRAIDFLAALRHPASTAPGRRFLAPDFWQRIIRRIYGPRHPDGSRVVRTVLVMIPRGARKTTIGAALSLLHTFGYERRQNGRVILAASAEEQAELAYDEALGFTKATPMLRKVARVVESQLYIQHPKSGAELLAIPAQGGAQLGKSPSLVLVDELCAFQHRKLWKALKTAMPKLPNTLMVIITTAGRGHENLAYDEYKYAKEVALGNINNPAYLPIIFEPPKKYSWQDEKVWHLVNPGLSQGFPDLEGMRAQAKEVENKPADRADFQQYNLNDWLDHAEQPFIDMAVWDLCDDPVDVDQLRGLPCWISVDLAPTNDLSSIGACWRDGDQFYLKTWNYCPQDDLQRRSERDGVPYQQWAEEGYLTPTPGNTTDFGVIEDQIRELHDQFDVREIGFDPNFARQTISRLLEDGLPVVEIRQSPLIMSPMIAESERIILSRKLAHGGDPVLRWAIGNVNVDTNKYGSKMFTKARSKEKIDPAVAGVMAIGRAALAEDAVSVYSNNSITDDALVEMMVV